METHRSKRASLDRQTQLAHLTLVSRYYGYSNLSRPQTDNTPAQTQYRRAGHSYAGYPTERTMTTEKRTSEPIMQQQQLPSSPTRRPRPSRTLERTSFGSNGSTPSLIDDKTDSELSHDDDYQYHASTSQLWDSFWGCQNGDGSKVRQYVGPQQDQSQKIPAQEPSTTRYPALIPSPHIKRTKKTSIIKYEDETVPPRPVQYSIPVPQPEEPAQKTLPPQWPSTTTTEEKRRTIRAVKSSYSLFPRQPSATPAPPVPAVNTSRPPPVPTARPRADSLSRPASGTSALVTAQRKSSRPQPVHVNSDPLPQIPEPREAPAVPTRPHTSHGPSRARAYTAASRSSAASLPSHLCDPAGVRTTIPLFPSTNLADLINPRSAPRPPVSSDMPAYPSEAPAPGLCRRLFSAPRTAAAPSTAATQKSFFDFDSDSDVEVPEPKAGGISRIMKKGRKSKSSMEAPPARLPSQDLPRASVERIRRRKSRTNLAILGRRNTGIEEPCPPLPFPEERERKKSDVFGRMFGRGKH